MDKEPDFQILKDKHVGNDGDDLFGYNDIAENVLSVITRAEAPFTIGLYGQWGLGKSSVCGLVQSRLEKSKDYSVFYFDTWKYERDSFRRQFLIELDQDVFGGELDYRNLLNQSLTISSPLPFVESLRKSTGYFLRKIFTATLIPLFIGVLGLVLALAVNNYLWSFLNNNIFLLLEDGINAVLILGVLAYIVKFILESIKIFEAEVNIPRTDSAEGFEYFYTLALQKLPKSKKLLVIIDNLDRLDHEKGVALLSDIKTFLANEKLGTKSIFLIPCDDSALADQLRSVYKENIDADEFLRKFFNISIRLPRLLDSSLDSFIEKKLYATDIPVFRGNHSLTFVIGRAFKNNPREIIQFVNTLTAAYLLARTRGLSRVVEKRNIPFLAKVLAVRVKWPESYKVIEEKVVRTSDTLANAVWTMPANEVNKEEKQNLDTFLSSTVDIKDEESGDEVYFTLYQSPEQKILPEWPAFLSAALDARTIDLKKIYESVSETADKEAALSRLLRQYYNRNSGKHESVIAILRSLHHLVSEKSLPILEPFIARAYNSPDTIAKHFKSIPFDRLLSVNTFGELETQTQRNIASGLIKVLENVSVKNMGDEEDLHQSIIYLTLLAEDALKPTLDSYRSEIVKVKTNILSKLDINQFRFEKDVADYLTNFLLLFETRTPLGEPMLFPGLYQFFMLIQHSSFTDKKYIEEVMDKANEFLENIPLPKSIPDQADKDRLSQFSSQAIVHYSSTSDWGDLKKAIVRVLLKLWRDDNPQLGGIKQSISDFISNNANSAENIISTFGKSELLAEMADKQEISIAIAQRTRITPDLFIALELKNDSIKESELTEALRNLEASDRDAYIRMLKHLKYSLPESSKQPVLKSMGNSLESLDDSLLQEWLDTIGKIGVPEEGKERFGERLKHLTARGGSSKEIVKKFIAKHKKIVSEQDAAIINSA